MSIFEGSRYQNCVVIKEEDNTTWISGRSLITKKDFNDNIYYTWQEKDRYDLIAHKYYNDPSYWWVVAEFNNKMHFLDEPENGEVIVLPSLETLISEILPSIQ